jgi:hypothetical protein
MKIAALEPHDASRAQVDRRNDGEH